MAWMPGVDTGVRAGDGNSRLVCRPDIVCIHTIVGYAPAAAAHFSTNAGGKIWQHRDTSRQSAANLNGNDHIIAIENEDHGSAFGPWSGSNVPPFTAAQIEAIAKICAWAHKTHGIPLVACPNSRPGSRGIAFHRQGIDGNYSNGRVSGGELWSSARGKVCPGDRRIAQIPQIISRAREIAGLGGDDLQSDERSWLADLHMALISGVYIPNKKHDPKINKDLGYIIKVTNQNVDAVEGKVTALANQVAALVAKVDKLAATQVNVDEAAIAAAVAQAINLDGTLSPEELQAAVEAAVLETFRDQWAK